MENSVNNLRQPLRYLDRSEYIRIEEGTNYLEPYWSGFTPSKVIVTRFPFNMTYSKQITEVRKLLGPLNSRFYSQKLKDKYILPYTEKIVHRLIGKFKNKIKDIDPILLDVYNECEQIYKKEKGVPRFFNQERVSVVHMVEVLPQEEDVASYTQGADYLIFTPRMSNEDPCEVFRKQLEQMKK